MLDMGQNRIRKPKNITFDPELLSQIEEHLEALPHKVAFAQWIETAAREQLLREKGKKK